jgi:hypothetical protein
MQHLESERLAALDHDAPTLDELAHLAGCAGCRAERDAFVALTVLARESAHAEGPRLTSWESLSSALRTEGLLTSTVDITPLSTPLVVRALDGSVARVDASPVVEALHAGAAAPSAPTSRRTTVRRAATVPAWTRIAAAVALMAGGAVAGRLSAGASALPAAGSLVGASDSAMALVNASVGAALQNTSLGGNESFASVQEATVALGEAQRVYERASLWLASNDTTTRSSDVYRARLAALDQMMAASRAALREAPQDPVLNHYFLATYTAREATLQQLGGALPVDKTIESY